MTAIYQFGHNDPRRYRDNLPRFQTSMSHDIVDYTDYRFEVARLNSFANWPVPIINPRKLAAAGFYYTNNTDKVKCFECELIVNKWQEDDNPMTEHQRWSAKCRFINNLPCGNVPIGVNPDTIPPYKKIDAYEYYGLKYMPHSGPDNDLNEGSMRSNTNSPRRNTKIGVFFDESNTMSTVEIGAEYSEYVSYTRRLQSFKSWPEEKLQKKEDLAAAGFFYSGISDKTFCYHCGVGLTEWEPTDEPVQEHIRWSRECPFIKGIQAKKQSEKNDDHQCAPPETKTEDVPDPSRESKTPDSS